MEVRRRGVAQITHHLHHLVVAEQGDHFAALRGRLPLELHQQFEGFARLGPAVGNVTHLHEDGRATRPLVVGVDQIHPLQDAKELLVRTVYVSDGNDTLRRARRRRPRRRHA